MAIALISSENQHGAMVAGDVPIAGNTLIELKQHLKPITKYTARIYYRILRLNVF